ncbi:MAG: hypothetical protein AB1546_00185 [bacterium]
MYLSDQTFFWFFSTLAQSDVALIAFLALIYFHASQNIEKKQNNFLDQLGGRFSFFIDFSVAASHTTLGLSLARYKLSEIDKTRIVNEKERIIKNLSQIINPQSSQHLIKKERREEFYSKFKSFDELIDLVGKDENNIFPVDYFDNEKNRDSFIHSWRDLKERIRNLQNFELLYNEEKNLKTPFKWICYLALSQFFISIFGIIFVDSTWCFMPNIFIDVILKILFYGDIILLFFLVWFSFSFFRRLIKSIFIL